MITGDIKNQIDRIWDSFWSGGISNPLEVIEQITYLLFIRRLDDLHTFEENKANRLKKPMERRVFPAGKDSKSRPYDYFWSPLNSAHKAAAPSLCVYIFASRVAQHQVLKRNRPGVKAGLNFEDIWSFIVPLSPIELQHQFRRRVTVVEKLKKNQHIFPTTLDTLIVSLQHCAFRCELSPSD